MFMLGKWQCYMNQLNSKYSEKSKMKELFHSSSKFILITLKPMVDGTGEEVEDDDLVGFLMWRFDFEDTLIQNVKQSVTYCYELQIESDYFGLGFGSRLIEILSLISCRVSIRKIMLTVQIINESALKFYRHLSFEIDDISPSKFEQKTDYEILSKVVL
ncbi:hypothetical protein PPACK8108_LOCUS16017 [Phakopsora pachyrhizi]|uniref:N-alpha-acetyltransferase 40 n=1 Tax=Phakopsora pachyrhizi TaxID=170000 RepID=A0AAV0B9P6_PHAPC|nr:hypothetical protein PPACK8108_LOCUS16017 [Phakopsora pachyrhizi]